ncbi:MAG: heparan-alpha-glucosaminide N-acetyltransferase [Hyphomicrobiales bacterium]
MAETIVLLACQSRRSSNVSEPVVPSLSPSPPMPRLHTIDALRGVALFAMIVFHASWNVDFFGFAHLGVLSHTGWVWFARGIAGSFIFLAGVSFVLADRAGQDKKSRWRRILKIAIAATAVSIVTYSIFPDSFVYFGILHHIALASLLAWPLLRLNSVFLAVVAVGLVLVHETYVLPFSQTRWLAWIGLSENVPPANDYVPLLPWFAVFVTGLAVGQTLTLQATVLKVLSNSYRWFKPLVWMGKRSLIIYLLHQPILFGMAFGLFSLSNWPNPG